MLSSVSVFFSQGPVKRILHLTKLRLNNEVWICDELTLMSY